MIRRAILDILLPYKAEIFRKLIQPQLLKKPTYGENTATTFLPQVLKKSTCGRIFYLHQIIKAKEREFWGDG